MTDKKETTRDFFQKEVEYMIMGEHERSNKKLKDAGINLPEPTAEELEKIEVPKDIKPPQHNGVCTCEYMGLGMGSSCENVVYQSATSGCMSTGSRQKPVGMFQPGELKESEKHMEIMGECTRTEEEYQELVNQITELKKSNEEIKNEIKIMKEDILILQSLVT